MSGVRRLTVPEFVGPGGDPTAGADARVRGPSPRPPYRVPRATATARPAGQAGFRRAAAVLGSTGPGSPPDGPSQARPKHV
ncbi:hypothetical protein GCM10027028_37790 [Streptomyces sundarbansensis]